MMELVLCFASGLAGALIGAYIASRRVRILQRNIDEYVQSLKAVSEDVEELRKVFNDFSNIVKHLDIEASQTLTKIRDLYNLCDDLRKTLEDIADNLESVASSLKIIKATLKRW